MNETYWQKLRSAFGPETIEQYDTMTRQIPARDAIEGFIIGCKAESVFDVGCNTGVLAYRLLRKGYVGKYVGLDSNPLAVAAATRLLGSREVSFVHADATGIPQQDGSFDVVVSKDVIEHVRDYVPILREAARIAKKHLILSMFIRMHDQDDVIRFHWDGYFLNRYNRKRLYEAVALMGCVNPRVVFQEVEDEVIVFDKFRA